MLLVLFLLVVGLVALEGGGGGGGGGRDSEAGGQPQGEAASGQQPQNEQVVEQPKPITLSGSNNMATDFFQLEQGLAVFKMGHQGQGNFIVTLLDDQGKEVGFALGNEVGPVSVSNALRIARPGKYVLQVEADGPWNTRIEQPRPSSAPQKTSFSSEDNTATPLFELSSGLKRVSMTHQGQGNFIVTLLDQEGREVAFALANEVGNAQVSTTATIPQDGIYLFTVEADGPWTIDIE